MKKARLILSASMLSIAAFSAVTFTSCSKDDESCPAGMEGKDCNTESRAKFIKTWSASDEVGSGSPLVYTCNITKGTNVNQVLISNSFAGNFFDNAIKATVEENTITIASQAPDAGGDYKVSGSGTYSGGQITWNYLIIESSTGDEQSYSGIWN